MKGTTSVLLVLLGAAGVSGFAPGRTRLISSRHPVPRQTSYNTNVRLNAIRLKDLGTLAVFRGGGVNDADLIIDTWEWCANLGAPAALVAGAVLATLSETRGDMSPQKVDKRWMRWAKKACRFLLLSAFALEIVSIFATTVTGTMLLAHGDRPAGIGAGVDYNSPMGFLRHNHEFEYLTARITFIQGLFNWLIAVALEVIVPKEEETATARKMNYFISSSLLTLILMMLSFYNGHMTFYQNYAHMLHRYFIVTMKRFFWRWPPRPMSLLVGPSMAITSVLGWRAFNSHPDDD